MAITKTRREIEAEVAKAVDIMDGGESPFFGMSYEEGIIAMGDWISGNQEEAPLDDA